MDTLMKRLRGCADELGTTMLEMAIVLPVFFLLLFGIFDFSMILFGYCNATYACRQAARYASVTSSTSLAPCTAAALQTMVKPLLVGAPANGTTITETWSPANTVGSNVKISVTIVYPTFIPFSSLHQVTVGSSAQRVITR